MANFSPNTQLHFGNELSELPTSRSSALLQLTKAGYIWIWRHHLIAKVLNLVLLSKHWVQPIPSTLYRSGNGIQQLFDDRTRLLDERLNWKSIDFSTFTFSTGDPFVWTKFWTRTLLSIGLYCNSGIHWVDTIYWIFSKYQAILKLQFAFNWINWFKQAVLIKRIKTFLSLSTVLNTIRLE